MGAKNSREPRSVAMENPSPAGVIDISDDVVKRLKQGITQQERENASSAQDSKAAPKSKPTPAKAPTREAAAASAPQTTVVYQSPVPIFVPGGQTVSAADVQRQMNQELEKNDEQWRKRFAQLEKDLNKTNTIMEQEYANALENVQKRFINTSGAHKTPPCQSLKAQLLACYRAHPGETLKCMEEVAQFKQCVDEHRIKKLDTEPVSPESQKMLAAKAPVAVPKAG